MWGPFRWDRETQVSFLCVDVKHPLALCYKERINAGVTLVQPPVPRPCVDQSSLQQQVTEFRAMPLSLSHTLIGLNKI